MQVKLLLFTFYVNGELHAVSIGKPSERMSYFSFPHIPSLQGRATDGTTGSRRKRDR